MPAIACSSRTAKDNSGVGLKFLNKYVFIPLAFKTKAASLLNNFELLRESYAMTTPLSCALYEHI